MSGQETTSTDSDTQKKINKQREMRLRIMQNARDIEEMFRNQRPFTDEELKQLVEECDFEPVEFKEDKIPTYEDYVRMNTPYTL